MIKTKENMHRNETIVSLLRKTKKDYYEKLKEKDVNDNKTFWKTVKPFLSDKIVSKEQITLLERDHF